VGADFWCCAQGTGDGLEYCPPDPGVGGLERGGVPVGGDGAFAPRGQDPFDLKVGQVEESLQLGPGEGLFVGSCSLFWACRSRLDSVMIWAGERPNPRAQIRSHS